MTRNKLEAKKEIPNLIFFQNLVPGKQESPLIEQFREQCINTEEEEEVKQYRQQLLVNQFPPVLTFRNKKQEGEFYDVQARACSGEFCCGGLEAQENKNISQDNYKLSLDTGKLYEGSASHIRTQLEHDLSSEPVWSAKYEQLQSGMKGFDVIAAQRLHNQEGVMKKETLQQFKGTLAQIRQEESTATENKKEGVKESAFNPLKTRPEPSKD